MSQRYEDAVPPDTLWDYYKQCKASGFLAMLPLLTPADAKGPEGNPVFYGTEPHVIEYRRLHWSERRLLPTSAEHAHLWPVYVQHIHTRLSNHYEPATWRNVRADIFCEMFHYLRNLRLPEDLTKVGY